MNTIERALLFLKRNKKKSLTLLFILTIVGCSVLACISVGNAADQTLDDLRKSMGGYFKVRAAQDQGTGAVVDDTMVEAVLSVGGIKAYNGNDLTYLMVEDQTLVPGKFSAEGDEKARLARIIGNTDSSLSEYFVLDVLELCEGRHITAQDQGTALISQELAQLNGLSVGDMIAVSLETEETVPLEIVGIFQPGEFFGKTDDLQAECDKKENFIFTDTAFFRELYGQNLGKEITAYKMGVSFFTENPKEMNGIISRMLKLEGYDWSEYEIIRNNKAYETSAKPLEQVSGYIRILVWVIIGISAAILALILLLWMKERVHEMGIYLSIGIRKREILLQHLVENCLIAGVAFVIAAFLVTGLAKTAEKTVTEQLLTGQETASETADSGTGRQGTQSLAGEEEDVSLELAGETENDLELRVGGQELLQVGLLIFLIVVIATGIASLLVIRLKPREILSNAG